MGRAGPSVAEIRAVAQHEGVLGRYSGEHWAGRLYARRISAYVTWALVRTPLSANAITVLMAAVGAAGAALFAFRGIWGAIVGAVLIQLYLILDCSDGEVARIRGATSAAGIFLDRLGHYVVEAILFVAMGVRAAWPHLGTGEPLQAGSLRVTWMTVGVFTALLHVLGKVQTDLVHVSRAKAGFAAVADDAETAAPRGKLRGVRRAAGLVPLYRLTGAIEASLIALAVVLWDQARGSYDPTHGFVIGMFFVTALVFAGHFLMILASSRLRP